MYVYIHAPHKSDIGFSALQLHVVHISISACKVDLCVQKPTPGRAVCSSGATMNPNANQGFLSVGSRGRKLRGGDLSSRRGLFWSEATQILSRDDGSLARKLHIVYRGPAKYLHRLHIST